MAVKKNDRHKCFISKISYPPPQQQFINAQILCSALIKA